MEVPGAGWGRTVFGIPAYALDGVFMLTQDPLLPRLGIKPTSIPQSAFVFPTSRRK